MAHQRDHHAWLGSFRDSSFGIDDEGELFRTLEDATAALHARHREADGWIEFPVARPSGFTMHITPATLTNEAHILLWRLDPVDHKTGEELQAMYGRDEDGIPVSGYLAERATHVVWVGARQAIRVGSLAEFEEQRAVRNQQDVREAGSVVVTDA